MKKTTEELKLTIQQGAHETFGALDVENLTLQVPLLTSTCLCARSLQRTSYSFATCNFIKARLHQGNFFKFIKARLFATSSSLQLHQGETVDEKVMALSSDLDLANSRINQLEAETR